MKLRLPAIGLIIALPIAMWCTQGFSVEATATDLISVGEHIYRTGLRPDGTAVIAYVQDDVALPAGAGACASCHRRSGIGVAEGGTPRSLSLTAPTLFTAKTQPPYRPAYDRSSLITAIVTGIAADGRELDDLMPQYQLTDADAEALAAYLRTLGREAAPGVTGTHLEIATIISEDVSAENRRAIEDVLARFVQIKNAGTRREAERAAASQRHVFGRNKQRAHRDWNLSVWTLSGPATSWPEQLDTYYKDNPPFAIVSGSTGHDWQIVHDFCERREVPCVLPITEVPVEDRSDFYTLYFSEGASLQAEITAKHIATQNGNLSVASLLLITTDDERGRSAREAFLLSPALATDINIHEQILPARTLPSARDWQRLLAQTKPEVVVAWLGNRQLQGLFRLGDSRVLPQRIYTAASFSSLEAISALPTLHSLVRHVYPYSLPTTGRLQFPREQLWLEAQNFSHLNPFIAAQTLFAAHVLGEGLSDIQTNFSREYLLETFEHSLDQTQMTSFFPNTTIGPGQRFISRGAFVVQLGAGTGKDLFAFPVWIEP